MPTFFFTRFLISSVVISVLTMLVWAVKNAFRNHISARWQYNIWFLVLLMLVLPFIPYHFLPEQVYDGLTYTLPFSNGFMSNTANSQPLGNILINNGEWLNDFYLSVNTYTPQLFNTAMMVVWLAGMLVFIFIITSGHFKIIKIKKTVVPICNERLNQIFSQCLWKLKIKSQIAFGESPLVKTPMTVGFLKPYIILPKLSENHLKDDEIYYIAMHELIHHKHKDVLINYLMCLLQTLYWFNPIVYFAFKEMRTDREMACDSAILSLISKRCYADYGMTIIRFAEMFSKGDVMPMVAGISGTKKQITRRIEKIAAYRRESSKMKLKSLCIFMIIGLMIFSQSPVISAMDKEKDTYHFSADNVAYENLENYFEGFNGSFVLYDVQKDKYSIYNEEKSVQRVSPNSTYKIYSALIGLDKGMITADKSLKKWDGKIYPVKQWNKNHDLASAMKSSVNWYFQDLDKSVGVKELQAYYKKMKYGNYNLLGGVDDYWTHSTLRISPVEQVMLLKDFHANDTIFKTEHVNTVKSVLKLSEKDGAALFGKTGTGNVNGDEINGWFVGYVENEGRTYIFAANISGKANATGSQAAKIVLSILSDKKIY